MRSYYDIQCQCGHEGQVSMKENDQPYSAEWAIYSLKGFDGRSFYVKGQHPDFKTIIQELEPKCPKCGIFLSSLKEYKR